MSARNLQQVYQRQAAREMRDELVKKLVAKAARRLGMATVPKVRVVKRKRGHAWPQFGWFSLPDWVLTRHEAFLTWYVVHELAHFGLARRSEFNMRNGKTKITSWYTRDHGKEFRRVETEAAERFGLRLIPGRVYIKGIRDLKTGETLCDEHGQPAVYTPDYQI